MNTDPHYERPADPPPTWKPSSGPPPSPKRGRVRVVAAVVCVALVVAAIVGTVAFMQNHQAEVAAEERRAAAAAKAASESAASASSKAAREREEAEALEAAQEEYDGCLRLVDPLQESLAVVDARLDVGLSQGDLSDLVGDVSIAYNQVPIDQLGSGNCLFAAAEMETAFNAYRASVSKWNDCLVDFYCDLDLIDPFLQRKWLKAGRALAKTERLLAEMDPESPTYVEGSAGEFTV